MTQKLVATVLITAITLVAFAQPTKPNFTGTWERTTTTGAVNVGTEVMMIVHQEPYIYLLYRIKDTAGERTLDLKGMTDGKLHTQEVEGQPAIFMAWWEGQQLVLDITREASFGYGHSRRKITLSTDGKTMTAERAGYNKDGTSRGTGTEKWEKK